MLACSVVKTRDPYPHVEIRRGLIAAGYTVQYYNHTYEDDYSCIVTWTPWKGSVSYKLSQRHTHKCVVMENGYIPEINGEKYYCAGLGGFNGRGNHKSKDSPADRWRSFNINIEPWRSNSNGHILVVGQFGHKDTDISMPVNWPDTIIKKIRANYHTRIIYRPKARGNRKIVPSRGHKNLIVDEDTPIEGLIAGAKVVVVYSSKASVMSLLMGVPVIVAGPYCITKELASQSLDNLRMPNREQFFYDLAYSQWSAREIEHGIPFKRLVQ